MLFCSVLHVIMAEQILKTFVDVKLVLFSFFFIKGIHVVLFRYKKLRKDLYQDFAVVPRNEVLMFVLCTHTHYLKVCSACMTDTDPISEIHSFLRRMLLPASVSDDTRCLCSSQVTFIYVRHCCEMGTYSEFCISLELLVKNMFLSRNACVEFCLNELFHFFFQNREDNSKLTDW